MSSATKPVEQKARELLSSIQFLRELVRHDAPIESTMIRVGLLRELLDVAEAALNTDGERIRREALTEAANWLRTNMVAVGQLNAPLVADAMLEELGVTNNLDRLADILSTPSKGVG